MLRADDLNPIRRRAIEAPQLTRLAHEVETQREYHANGTSWLRSSAGLLVNPDTSDDDSTTPTSNETFTSTKTDWFPVLDVPIQRITTITNGTPLRSIGGPTDGKTYYLINVGTKTLLLTNNDPAGTPGFRILTPTGGTLTIDPGKEVTLQYDTTAGADGAWRVIDGSALTGLFGTSDETFLTSQTDWLPVLDVSIQRLTTLTDGTTLRSIGNPADGKIYYLINTGTKTLLITNNDPAGTPGFRILTSTGGTLTIDPGKEVTLQYDGTAGAWRVIDGSALTGTHPERETFSGGIFWPEAVTVTAGGTTNNLIESTLKTFQDYDTSAGAAVVTGWVPPSTPDGYFSEVLNIGPSDLTINNQDAGSSANNRIITPDGNPYVLKANYTVARKYDATLNRWRLLVQTPPATVVGSSSLFGNLLATTVSLSATAYFGPGETTTSTTETNARVVIGYAATLKSFYLRTSTAQPASGSLVLTVLKNGAATAVTFTIAAGGAAGLYSNTANLFSIDAGDEISIQATNNGLAVSAAIRGWSLEVDR